MVERVKRGRGRPSNAEKAAQAPSADENELAAAQKEIIKRYGEGSFLRGCDMHQPIRIPTGIFMLDFALLGGVPGSRITHVVGERHSGKSMVSDKIIAHAQQMFPDSIAVKVDVEGTHDSVWSSKLGVDTERLMVSNPETGEHAVDVADAMVHSKEVSIVVVDSIAALTPFKEVESSAEDAMVGEQARLVGRMVRKMSSGIIKERRRGHYPAVILVNQFRMKIGVMYGDPRTTPGGKALEFAASVNFIMKNKETVGKDAMDVEAVTENDHSFNITKNKLNGGPRTGEFRLRRVPNESLGLAEGEVDDAGTLLSFAKKFGIYSGGGAAWRLSFWDFDKTFRNSDAACKYLYENRNDYWLLRNYLIWAQAGNLGMPESFLEQFLPEGG